MMALILAIIGGFISRMCGGGKPHLPLGLEQFLYALPYGVVLYQYPVLAVISYGLAVVGKRMGHGQYIHLGFTGRQIFANDEQVDGVIRFFFGVDRGGNYWRCVAGLALTGLIVTVPCGLAYAFTVSFPVGLLIAVSGATKALSYMIGWAARVRLIYPTVVGEILTGVFGWGILSLLTIGV